MTKPDNSYMFPICAVVRALRAVPADRMTPSFATSLSEGEDKINQYCRTNMIEPMMLWGDYDTRAAR